MKVYNEMKDKLFSIESIASGINQYQNYIEDDVWMIDDLIESMDEDELNDMMNEFDFSLYDGIYELDRNATYDIMMNILNDKYNLVESDEFSEDFQDVWNDFACEFSDKIESMSDLFSRRVLTLNK